MQISKTLQVMCNGILVCCALFSTSLAYRALKRSDRSAREQSDSAQRVAGWETQFRQAQLAGRDRERAAMVVFSDYECPACKALNDHIESYRRDRGLETSVLYRHWALPSHQHAVAAAVSAECAAEQGKFRDMHNELFRAQRHLATVDWRELASAAGVPDLPRFESCINDADVTRRVQAASDSVGALGLRGTPSILLKGGRVLTGVPARAMLDSLLGAVAN